MVVLVLGVVQVKEVNSHPPATHPCYNQRLGLGCTPILT
jgi:hypothetical protein